jgi:DnaJ-class molecular chaperone
MPAPKTTSTIDTRPKCETCNGTGFLPKMGAVMPGERDDEAVDVCPTCDGTGLKDKLAH